MIELTKHMHLRVPSGIFYELFERNNSIHARVHAKCYVKSDYVLPHSWSIDYPVSKIHEEVQGELFHKYHLGMNG